ncbi:MFS transporter [Orrella sp. NBD-18]|uniref:MFS transporter n=1 Tax=Sheuella amnicola TaxID=2707330 RepID=A0A6B2R2G1_9BURK|nr:MFS transporter [Sheuella amnicola]NDY84303.1 MFS transporter [Sheuella amnicola]HBI82859.1 hypothetical protein [Alcaligenaceae bacterium]
MFEKVGQRKVFHGWWMVWGCMLVAIVAWSFALYGPSVYVPTLSKIHGWSVGTVSSALTLSFLVNATVLSFVGSTIQRIGPTPVMLTGSAIMATGLASMGRVNEIWQVYVAFALMGLGWSCVSTTAITSSLAPWFERHQGRAVSTALLGASIGGMVGVPVLLALIHAFGFAHAMMVVAILMVTIVWSIGLLVMRHRPQDMGLEPDGLTPRSDDASHKAHTWTRRQALGTIKLQTVMLAFGLALMVQIGFLTHQVSLLLPKIGESSTALCVTASAMFAFGGRILLAKFSDRFDVRLIALGVLIQAAISLSVSYFFLDHAWGLIAGVLLYGMTAGNITTLPPLIVRREFGSASFGVVFGLCATLMQIMSAMGPGFFGILYDLDNNYALPLVLSILINLIAAVIIISGRTKSAS